MTEQEQKAFDQMREALELHMAEYSKAWKPGMEILEPIGDAALTAANAVSHPQATKPNDFSHGYDIGYEAGKLHASQATEPQAQGEAARLNAFLHKHKSSALPEGACVTCEGEGEIGGQFCGGFQECSDCAGTGKKSAHPQATEPAKRCWCETCRPVTLGDMRMVICPDCGNKRCPKATHHNNACTNSNDIGQKGSSWEHVKPAAPEAHHGK